MSLTPDGPKPDLSEHDEEATPFDDVMRKLLEAKPRPKKAPEKPEPSAVEESYANQI